jgi:hypothetical protein
VIDAVGAVDAIAGEGVGLGDAMAGATGVASADVPSFELLLNTLVLDPLLGVATGAEAVSGSACAACLSGARAASSEVGGRTWAPRAVRLMSDGSSRNLT